MSCLLYWQPRLHVSLVLTRKRWYMPDANYSRIFRLTSQLARRQHALHKAHRKHEKHWLAVCNGPGTIQCSPHRVAHLGSLSHVEQVSAQYFVLRWLVPAVPRSLLHGNNEAWAASVVSCPNDLTIATTAAEGRYAGSKGRFGVDGHAYSSRAFFRDHQCALGAGSPGSSYG